MARADDRSGGLDRASLPPGAAACVLTVVAVQLLSSVRFFFKYVETLPWAFYGLYVAVGLLAWVVVLRTGALLRLATRRTTLGAAVVGLLALVAVAYPKADALRAMGRGSDQDDCVRILVSNVFALRAPYGRGYFGDPCSTGPGELFVYFPVEVTDQFFVVVPSLAALLGYWVLTLVVARGTAVLLSLTQLVSWLFLELSSVGSDLIVIAWLFATATTASLVGLRRRHTPLIVVGATAYVLFASSRLPLVVVAAASLLLLFVACGLRAVRVVAPAVLVTVTLYFGSYAMAPSRFRPGHLVAKSGRILRDLVGVSGAWVLAISVLLLAVAATLLLRDRLSPVVRRHFFLMQLGIVTVPMALVAVWDLGRAGFDPAAWEGLHYLYLGMPTMLLVAAQVLASPRSRVTRPVRRRG
jgi:hypothetical protein